MIKVRREDVAKLFTWGPPPTPPIENTDGDGNYRAMWKRVFNGVDYQITRMDTGNRACNEFITVREIAKYAKVTPDFARKVMRDLGEESWWIKECFERL